MFEFAFKYLFCLHVHPMFVYTYCDLPSCAKPSLTLKRKQVMGLEVLEMFYLQWFMQILRFDLKNMMPRPISTSLIYESETFQSISNMLCFFILWFLFFFSSQGIYSTCAAISGLWKRQKNKKFITKNFFFFLQCSCTPAVQTQSVSLSNCVYQCAPILWHLQRQEKRGKESDCLQ